MASKTEIVNLALTHLAILTRIANVDTENSPEAKLARVVYDTQRDKTLRDFPWPFATVIAALGLVEEDPNDEWEYSYRYPVSCLRLRRILSGTRNDTQQSKVPYKIASDDSGGLVFSDEADAEVEYTNRITNPNLYSIDFIDAFSYRLAAIMAPALTGSDPDRLGERALRMYQTAIKEAKGTAFKEEQPEEPPNSEFINVRE